MGISVSLPPPPPPTDPDDTYNIDRVPYPPKRPKKPPPWFEGEEGSPQYWHAVTMEQKRQSLEDEWNAKQDKTNYFWTIVVAIAIVAAIAAAML